MFVADWPLNYTFFLVFTTPLLRVYLFGLLLVSILKFMKYICYYMFHYSDNILSKKTICYSKDGNFALVHSGASPEAHPSDQSSGGWSLHYLLFFIIIYFIIFCYYCRNILNKLWATNQTYICHLCSWLSSLESNF